MRVRRLACGARRQLRELDPKRQRLLEAGEKFAHSRASAVRPSRNQRDIDGFLPAADLGDCGSDVGVMTSYGAFCPQSRSGCCRGRWG